MQSLNARRVQEDTAALFGAHETRARRPMAIETTKSNLEAASNHISNKKPGRALRWLLRQQPAKEIGERHISLALTVQPGHVYNPTTEFQNTENIQNIPPQRTSGPVAFRRLHSYKTPT